MKEKDKSLFQTSKPSKGIFADEGFGNSSDGLSLYDPTNPDINIFDSVDGELVNLAGSQLLIYKYEQGQDFDDLYDEHRGKALYQHPVIAFGHYDPRPVEENLSEFGLELTNDQTFTFNLTDIDFIIGRRLRPGDVIKPKFQNLFYEIYEVQEDSFEIYGVFHLIVSAKLMRDAKKIIPMEAFNVSAIFFDRYDDQLLKLSDGYETEYDITIPRSKTSKDLNGFPLVVFLHGSGGSKLNSKRLIEFVAEKGFVGVAIDVRGQGPSAELNDPNQYGHRQWDMREVLDIFEVIESAVENFPIDTDRIGVTGRSQGGILSFLLAKFSEQKPVPYVITEWRPSGKTYPKISAIAPSNWGGSLPDTLIPRDSFAMNTAKNFWQGNAVSPIPWDEDGPAGQGVHHDPKVYDIYEPFLKNNKPLDAKVWFQGSNDYKHTFTDFEFIKTYTGHIHAFWAYDDAWGMGGTESTLLKLLQDSVPGFARWLHLGTGGHQTARIIKENTWLKTNRLAFFQAVFQDKKLPIPEIGRLGDFREFPQVRYGIVPSTDDAYQEDDDKWAEKYVWDINNSQDNEFGPAAGGNYTPVTYYFGINNELVEDPPVCPPTYAESELKHTVNYDFSYTEYYDMLKNPEAANGQGQGQVPMSRLLYGPNVSGLEPIMVDQGQPFKASTLTHDVLLCGSIKAEVYVETTSPNIQLGLGLWDRNPQGEERFVTGGYGSLKDHSSSESYGGLPPGIRKLDIPFNLYTYKVEAGHTLIVKATPNSFSEPAYPSRDGIFRIPPLPESFDLKILACAEAAGVPLHSSVMLPLHKLTAGKFLDV